MSEQSERKAAERAEKALTRLSRWTKVFVGWQLGTRTDRDAEAAAVRDHRELAMVLRAENNALLGLLAESGVITLEQWWDRLAGEADLLAMAYEDRFPGITATDDGLVMDVKRALVWMRERNWKP